MISWHPYKIKNKSEMDRCTRGYLVEDTNDVNYIANLVTQHVWSPNVFSDGYRRQASWVRADWLVLDFDDGEMTVRQACRSFCDMSHIIGITLNHQKEKEGKPAVDRFRVLLKFDGEITDLEVYRQNLLDACTKYPIDEACKDGARAFLPCREIVSTNDDGYLQEINTIVKHRAPAKIAAAHQRCIAIPAYARELLQQPWPPNTYNTSCYKIGAALAPLGYDVDKIVRLITSCPTYSGQVMTAALENEIRASVANGAKRAFRDLESLKQ